MIAEIAEPELQSAMGLSQFLSAHHHLLDGT
jgi:hypothetical protein